MNTDSGKRFVFRGNASGIGGNITKLNDAVLAAPELIQVYSSSSLPVAGGTSSTNWGSTQIHNLISFESASTSATGQQKGQNFETVVTSTIRKLTVGRRLELDTVTATLTSVHRGGLQPHISPTGTILQRMTLDKQYPVDISLAVDQFAEHATFDQLREAFGSNPEFQREHCRGTDTTNKYVVCSLVKKIECKAPGVKIDGNVIRIPNFGRIHVAELIIDEVSRRLTMLRFELGSPDAGMVACSEVESNGILLPN